MGRLDVLLRPASAAVIGANEDEATYGGRAWRFLRRDFGGTAMAVNRRPGAVRDGIFARTLAGLPSVPEVVVVATPGHTVLGLLQEAGRLGVRAAVVLSRDALGAETELRDAAAGSGMLVLGPNCLGLINANACVCLSSSISLEQPPRPGRLALVAQSGALMGTLHARATEAGIGIGVCVSTGSQAVVRVEDVLLELADDDEIDAVGVYVEDVDPEQLRAAVEALRGRGAAVVALKGGLTNPGSRVTAAHSGALASDGRVFRQLCRDLGVVDVDEPQDLLTTLALARRTRRRLFVATVSGGLSAVAADRAVHAGIELPDPAVRPSAGVVPEGPLNPLDLEAADTTAEEKAGAVAALARDEGADGVLVVLNDMPGLDAFLDELHGVPGDRLVLCSECSGQAARSLRGWVAGGGWHTMGIAQTFRALGRLRGETPPGVAGDLGPDRMLLAPDDVVALLQEHGVPMLPQLEVESAREAVGAAEQLGYPAVVKVARAAHRGASVRAGLTRADEVAAAADELIPFGPLLVQPQCAPGLELYLGVFPDPTFGWQLLIGAGGSCLEQIADVAVMPADRLERGIEDSLRRTSTGRWLLGGVGRGLLALDALEATARGALRAADALGSRLVSLDLNPVVVNDAGAVVVDAKVRVSAAASLPSPAPRTEERRP